MQSVGRNLAQLQRALHAFKPQRPCSTSHESFDDLMGITYGCNGAPALNQTGYSLRIVAHFRVIYGFGPAQLDCIP